MCPWKHTTHMTGMVATRVARSTTAGSPQRNTRFLGSNENLGIANQPISWRLVPVHRRQICKSSYLPGTLGLISTIPLCK
eukprot:m.113453 g.113453  ORF g.113453 m.113453 type:complete len:80 (+) comp14132_c0_seq2:183-422(+)